MTGSFVANSCCSADHSGDETFERVSLVLRETSAQEDQLNLSIAKQSSEGLSGDCDFPRVAVQDETYFRAVSAEVNYGRMFSPKQSH